MTDTLSLTGNVAHSLDETVSDVQVASDVQATSDVQVASDVQATSNVQVASDVQATSDLQTASEPQEIAEPKNIAPQSFTDIKLTQLRGRAEAYHQRGWRFVNLCGSTVDGGVELLYSFGNRDKLENLRLVVNNGEEVPAVSDLYFNAFVFENETHDLFGVPIKGMAIDFGGHFYDVSVPSPMNPASNDVTKLVSEYDNMLAVNSADASLSSELTPKEFKSDVTSKDSEALKAPAVLAVGSVSFSTTTKTLQQFVEPVKTEFAICDLGSGDVATPEELEAGEVE
ncbi:MAG: NADH-quinone oxidoreductase subunit C [Coriobacteriales bacterium]|jgi:NADH:ubiquinone oxidoreductase subunit C|nr:NADH-quinone oxidoreductase subunit C [Coriobacteriales bacterium]